MWLAFALLAHGEPPPAQAGTSPAIQAHYQRAQEALAVKDYATASREFEALLRIKPDMAEARANLGTVFYAQGRYPEAAVAFREALRRKPGLKGVGAFLGMSLARTGQTGEALPLLQSGFDNPINDEWRLEAGLLLAGVHQRAGDWHKAQQVITILEQRFPANAEVLYVSYRVHAVLGARAVGALARNAPGSARLQQLAAELQESEGDFPAAIAHYRKALEIEPTLPGGRRALGVALLNSSTDPATRKEADRLFREELAGNPGDAASEYQLGEVLWLNNQPGEASEHFARALQLQPSFTDALIAAGKVRTALGDAVKAAEYLERAVASDPANEVARYRLAQALQARGNRERAEQEFAEYRRLKTALDGLKNLYRQFQDGRITAQTIE